MVDRLRALLEDPHDPALARAVVLLACAVTLGLTVAVGLGGSRGGDEASRTAARTRPRPYASTPLRPTSPRVVRAAARHRPEPRQDPQDRPGSPAARRARRELATHRALQRLPWRHDGLSIELVGASGAKALLEVSAPSVSAARADYRSFLRSSHDDGQAYLPRFHAVGRRG